jgi:hypothetical protein
MDNQTHETWQRAKGHRIFRSGDKMRAHVPGRKTTAVVTFKAHVVPARGVPYLEIIDHGMRHRCISPDAVTGGAR